MNGEQQGNQSQHLTWPNADSGENAMAPANVANTRQPRNNDWDTADEPDGVWRRRLIISHELPPGSFRSTMFMLIHPIIMERASRWSNAIAP
jgi:hypothetical protein